MSICRNCGKEWEERLECHCEICHKHFKSIAGFLMHKAVGKCLSMVDEEMGRPEVKEGEQDEEM